MTLRRWVWAALGTGFAFGLATWLDGWPAVIAWNQAASVWLQGPAYLWLTYVSAAISWLFSGQVTLIGAVLIGLALWIAGRRRAAVTLSGLFATVAVEVLLKGWLRRPSPQHVLQVRALIDISVGPEFLKFSYPSGHAARITFALLWLAFWLAPRAWRGRSIAAASFVGAMLCWTRIYAGDHWLMDIVGGCLLAGFFLALAELGVALRDGTAWTAARSRTGAVRP